MEDVLKVLRKKRNLTQKELADLIGISVPAYQFYEYNKRFPKYEMLNRIIDALKLDAFERYKLKKFFGYIPDTEELIAANVNQNRSFNIEDLNEDQKREQLKIELNSIQNKLINLIEDENLKKMANTTKVLYDEVEQIYDKDEYRIEELRNAYDKANDTGRELITDVSKAISFAYSRERKKDYDYYSEYYEDDE